MRIVVVGSGKKVDFLVRSLINNKNKIVIINNNEKECKTLAHEYDISVIYGDGSKPFILEDAEIEGYDLLIALTLNDADNFVIAQLAKKQFNVKRVFATVRNPKNVDVFKQLGINTVISATYMLASFIEQMASIEEVVSYMPMEDGKIQLLELSISEKHKIANKQLSDFNFPQNAIIGCIMRDGHVIIPHGTTTVIPGDRIMVLTSIESKDQVVKALVGEK